MKTQTDQELIKIYDALPSLLDIATERARATGGNTYEIQNDLMAEYHESGTPFRWSMPYRSLFECFHCGHLGTEIQHSLYNPKMKNSDPTRYTVGLSEGDLHQIYQHGAAFPAKVRNFLMQFASPSA